MKNLILKILAILLIIFAFDRGISLYLDNLYQKNEMDYANGHLNYYLKHVECDTLFMGSSRTLHHIDSKRMGPSTYNLSKQGMSIGYQTAVISLLDQYNKLPRKLLIVDIPAAAMSSGSNESINEHIHHLKYYYNKNEFIHQEIQQRSKFEFIKYWLSSYRFNGNSSLLITNPIQHIGDRPYLGGYLPLKGRTMKIKVEDDPNLTSRKEGENFTRYINEIREICKRNHIRLVFTSTPYYGRPKNLTWWTNKMEDYMQKHKINYINFQHFDDTLQASSKLWSDPSHLNQKGSQIFTEIVKSKLKVFNYSTNVKTSKN